MDVGTDIDTIRENMYKAKFQNEIDSLKEDGCDADWIKHRIERLNDMIAPDTPEIDIQWKLYHIVEREVTIDIYVKGHNIYYFSKGSGEKDAITKDIVREFRSGQLFKSKKINENDAIELSPSNKIVKYLETI